MNRPFFHTDLNTTDLSRAKSFYGELFTWPIHDMDMGTAGTCTLFKPETGPAAA